MFCGRPLPLDEKWGSGCEGLPAPTRLASTKREYMAPPDSAVCNAEGQLIPRRYKPAPLPKLPGAQAQAPPSRACPALPAA